MRERNPRRWAPVAVALVLFASGCFIQDCEGDVSFDDVADFIAASLGLDVSVSACSEDEDGEGTSDGSFSARNLCCDYEAGSTQITSCSLLYREFGILGLWIDPLVLQVPIDVVGFSGTWDDGSASGPLDVRATDAFEADAFTTVVAEPGQQFLIFELPPHVIRSLPADPAVRTDFRLTGRFDRPSALPQPFDVKPMLTVRADVAGGTFFLPQIPCVTDFAQVPAVTIPVPADTQDLIAALTAAFTGVTGCNGAFYDLSGQSLDHDDYLLWKAKADAKPSGTSAVTDELGSRNLELKKLGLLGMPANTNGLRPNAPLAEDHFDVYQVKPSPGQPKEPVRKGVQVANLLGAQTLDLKKADQLWLPAARGDAPVPPLAAPNVEPYLCRKAKLAKGTPKLPKGSQALVTDAFGGAIYALKKPTRFCLPADVDGASAGAVGGEIGFTCFKAKPAKPRPEGRDGVHTTDAAGSRILRTKKPGELCLPSTFVL